MIYAILSLFLGVSFTANAVLFIKLRKSEKAPVPTKEAKEVLASLMQGQAIIRISVMDPENLMLRSPRR